MKYLYTGRHEQGMKSFTRSKYIYVHSWEEFEENLWHKRAHVWVSRLWCAIYKWIKIVSASFIVKKWHSYVQLKLAINCN